MEREGAQLHIQEKQDGRTQRPVRVVSVGWRVGLTYPRSNGSITSNLTTNGRHARYRQQVHEHGENGGVHPLGNGNLIASSLNSSNSNRLDGDAFEIDRTGTTLNKKPGNTSVHTFKFAILDADGDGVPDNCDACEGSDDNADADGDGTPDGCDTDDGADPSENPLPNECGACGASGPLMMPLLIAGMVMMKTRRRNARRRS